MENKTLIGIDFGTSSTVVTVKNYYDGMKNNECQPLLVAGSSVIPTLVFKNQEGQTFYGKDAETESGYSKGTLYRNFKMDLLSRDPDKREEAKALTKEFFDYLYKQFSLQEAALHVYENTCTYVSYPAKWSPDIIGFMKECASNAGFVNDAKDQVKGEIEPTAAIYAALTNHEETLSSSGLVSKNVPRNVMMLDLGAGTSDITIFRLVIDSENKVHVGENGEIISHPAIDNIHLCGGREIDDILYSYNEAYFTSLSSDGTVPPRLLRKNRKGVKDWKEHIVAPRLAKEESAGLPGHLAEEVEGLVEDGRFADKPYPVLDRASFENASREHWANLRTLIVEALDKARLVIKGFQGPEDIDLIILTGGHSQWYCVRQMCLGESAVGLPPINFSQIRENPQRLLIQPRPQETVANGLAFSELNFDVRHTSASDLWFELILDGKTKSELFHPVERYELLPLTKNVKWSQKISKGSFSLDSIPLTCVVYYGASFESAVKTEYTRNVFFNGLVSLLFKTALAPFFIGEQEDYSVIADITITINEDGTGIFLIKMSSSDTFTTIDCNIKL